ncbi:hypothetical protein GALL_212920 [mine drainage metagenome]|uniref:Uncharacterized protein n=1 Tax=mine drainage metagenome TaxID=410659 RepID=A0A1J5RKJ4_9ZZZZ
MNIAVLILLVMMVVLTYRKYQHDVSYKTQARSHVFDECLSLFQKPLVSQDQANLPILQGEYAGYQVALSVVEDTLGWRKLPPLWLLIKVTANKPSHGTLDMIVRPANNEFYSPSWQWDGNLTIPSSWPQHAIIKYQQQAIDLALLSPYIPALFKDLNMKELLVTPGMVRLTYMAKQAERGEYLIMRNAVYEETPISKNIVEALLRQAIVIRRAVENPEITAVL